MTGRVLTALVALALAAPAWAQETQTEREAAKDVLQKMDTLEKGLDLPSLIAKLAAPNPKRDGVATRAKQLLDTELLALSRRHLHPPGDRLQGDALGADARRVPAEARLRRRRSASAGSTRRSSPAITERAAAGRNLGVIVEYDALRGTKGAFHGDQHSTQGPIGIAAAIAIGRVSSRRRRRPAPSTVFGTPGEEMMPPNAKTVMHEAHVFDGMDVLVRSHSRARRPARRPASAPAA